jgi:replication factor A1
MVKIKELQPKKGFDEIVAQVTSVGEPRSVREGTLTVAEAELQDDSGSVKLTLWNDEVGKVKTGDTVKITNGWVNEFQGNISVSAGKFGQLEVTPGEPADDVKKAIDEDII